jgi:hypothetical protein
VRAKPRRAICPAFYSLSYSIIHIITPLLIFLDTAYKQHKGMLTLRVLEGVKKPRLFAVVQVRSVECAVSGVVISLKKALPHAEERLSKQQVN